MASSASSECFFSTKTFQPRYQTQCTSAVNKANTIKQSEHVSHRMRPAGIMFCEASNRDEVNTMGVSPRGFPRGSREIQNGRWAFLLVHTWSLPSQAEPLGLPLLSGPSSLLLSGQLTNGVGKLGVVAAYVDPTDTRPAFTYWYAWVTSVKEQWEGSISSQVLLTSLPKNNNSI